MPLPGNYILIPSDSRYADPNDGFNVARLQKAMPLSLSLSTPDSRHKTETKQAACNNWQSRPLSKLKPGCTSDSGTVQAVAIEIARRGRGHNCRVQPHTKHSIASFKSRRKKKTQSIQKNLTQTDRLAENLCSLIWWGEQARVEL